jgi:hypothetical protein
MRWNPKDRYRWKNWFAWYPVKVPVMGVLGTETIKMIWLETIQRRTRGGCYGTEVDYRTKGVDRCP